MFGSWNKCVHTVPAICPYHKEWLYYLFNIWVHRYTEAILTHEMRLLRNKRLSCNSSNCNSYISKRKVYVGLLQYHDATGAKLECKRQTAVTIYLKSEQLLLFAFALQHGRRTTPHYQHLECKISFHALCRHVSNVLRWTVADGHWGRCRLNLAFSARKVCMWCLQSYRGERFAEYIHLEFMYVSSGHFRVRTGWTGPEKN